MSKFIRIAKTSYIIISIILILFITFHFLIDKKVILLPEEEKMSSYKNKSYSAFSEWAKANGIEVITEYEYSDEIEKGNIIRTDVNEGTFVKNIKKINIRSNHEIYKKNNYFNLSNNIICVCM